MLLSPVFCPCQIQKYALKLHNCSHLGSYNDKSHYPHKCYLFLISIAPHQSSYQGMRLQGCVHTQKSHAEKLREKSRIPK